MGKDKRRLPWPSPRHILLQSSRATPLLHSSVVLENGLQRRGGMSSILNFQGSRHMSRGHRLDGLSPFLLSFPCVPRLVQFRTMNPSQTLTPVRWECETDQLHWGTRPELRAEYCSNKMWQGGGGGEGEGRGGVQGSQWLGGGSQRGYK